MSKNNIIHYKHYDEALQAACGIETDATRDKDEVTCPMCQLMIESVDMFWEIMAKASTEYQRPYLWK